MKSYSEPLQDKEYTGAKMRRLVNKYYSDLGNYLYVPFAEFYNFVRDIPYRRDVFGYEVISRPKYILEKKDIGMDCKKKGILVASWLRAHSIPYRFIASSTRIDKRYHHVFPQAKINGTWLNVDATKPENGLGETKILTAWGVL